MKFIEGKDRSQLTLFPVSLDASISTDNEVRLIDLFVDGLPLEEMGFQSIFVENGRPAYHPKDLLKLFIYGYLNRIRSSRSLEKECKRNIELIWLLKGLEPDHNTINRFRKENPKSIKKVFRKTVEIARNFDLIGGLLIAGDSTRLRAQNSKKNNYNQKKIARHLAFIEEKLASYTQALSEADGDKAEELEAKIAEKKKRQATYQGLSEKIKESGDTQYSSSDPESRHIMVRGMISEVCYNVQSTVDSKNKLPIDYKVTNENDSNALSMMVRRAKSIVGHNRFTVLFDKGYHKGEELSKVHELGVRTYVAIPDIPGSAQAPDPAYNTEHFTNNAVTDQYTCPAGAQLLSNQRVYRYDQPTYGFKKYKTRACATCKVRAGCTRSKQGRMVQRSEYQPAVDRNKSNLQDHPELYRARARIVEHPFGTLKRQWGFDYILTKKGMASASSDVGFMFIAYNLRRLFKLLGKEGLRKLFATKIAIYWVELPQNSWLELRILLKALLLRFFSKSQWKGLFTNYYIFERGF